MLLQLFKEPALISEAFDFNYLSVASEDTYENCYKCKSYSLYINDLNFLISFRLGKS
jgi:hypothetical protein